MKTVSNLWTRGDFFIWLTGATLAACMIMITGLLLAVLANSIVFFWPGKVHQFQLKDGTTLIGEITDRERIPAADGEEGLEHRIQVKRGNRDLYGDDFVWIDESNIVRQTTPGTLTVLERREWGNFYGTPVELRDGDRTLVSGPAAVFRAYTEKRPAVAGILDKIKRIEQVEIGSINFAIEKNRLKLKKLALDGIKTGATVEALQRTIKDYQGKYQGFVDELGTLRNRQTEGMVVGTADGGNHVIPLHQIVRAFQPNGFGVLDRLGYFLVKIWEFIWEDPRESNTEGGVFPAIFGTVMMVMIMTVVVTPLGVLAAFYLREYAQQGKVVSQIRIAVNNLAGVPSIVFGVFGVGFFIYFVGGSMDRLFFPESLPTPTFGTGGILWASLTLALLTVPMVIVATEEGLAAVPQGTREAALALGATKFEMISRVVLPAVLPSILTGLILAMARAAGEVAPLMITGVVKLAPSLPIDSYFPFLHLDRKFMHLGFHIYDVGFQSPNVDAARPMVYTTTLLLLIIVIGLNSVAIWLRNRLRRKLTETGL